MASHPPPHPPGYRNILVAMMMATSETSRAPEPVLTSDSGQEGWEEARTPVPRLATSPAWPCAWGPCRGHRAGAGPGPTRAEGVSSVCVLTPQAGGHFLPDYTLWGLFAPQIRR